jgi:argininosuccinate lyase
MENPAAKAWSGRFEGSLNETIYQFNASIPFDIELIEYDIQGSKAHAQMLGETGIIALEEQQKLITALDEILDEWRRGNFRPEPEAEDVHYAVEKRLIALVGDLGKKLHTARSRNDQVAVDLRLYVRDHLERIDTLLRALQGQFLSMAEEHVETLIPGYTHLQRAQPVSLAHHLLAYFEMFKRDRERLVDLKKRVNISPLGSGALAGTTLPIQRHLTATLLGFSAPSENSLDAVSDRDYVVEFMSASSLILVHLSRLSEELIIWASQEFGFIALTDRCSTGSSLMPQKKNPDVPELIRGKTGRVFGNLVGLLTTLKALPLAYNKDLQEDKEGLFDTVRTVENCVQAMTILLAEGIVIRSERLAQATTEDFSNATDVADYLVRKGVPFREAYNLVGTIVRTCLQENLLLLTLPLERWQQFHPAFDADLYEAIAPQQVVAARNSYGGTGFEQVRAALGRAQAWWQEHKG